MKTRVTARMSKEMKADRAAGMTLREVQFKYNVSMWAVYYHSSDAAQQKMKAYEKARYERDKHDPEKLEKRRARALRYYRENSTSKTPRAVVSPETVKSIRAARDMGLTFAQIADRLGISHTTAHKYGKASGAERRAVKSKSREAANWNQTAIHQLP